MKIFKTFFRNILNPGLDNSVNSVYLYSTMEKDIVSARVRPELRKAFKREAKKNDRTLSYYVEQLLEEIAKIKKLV